MFWRPLNRQSFVNLSVFICRNVNSGSNYGLLKVNNYHSCTKINVLNNLKNQKTFLYPNHRIKFNYYHNGNKQPDLRHKTTVYYASAILIFTLGMTYAAVPLYRIFCQAYSYGGTIVVDKEIDLSSMKKQSTRELTIKFNADVSSSLNWKFKPQLDEIKVMPGETALAFYTAENPLDRPVVGISTYNVVPFEAGPYFNKIQCFCFEEQMLNPHEQVDMPVFFYIDPEFVEDPKLQYTDQIVLSYTFFEVKDGMNLPFPSYYAPHKN